MIDLASRTRSATEPSSLCNPLEFCHWQSARLGMRTQLPSLDGPGDLLRGLHHRWISVRLDRGSPGSRAGPRAALGVRPPSLHRHRLHQGFLVVRPQSILHRSGVRQYHQHSPHYRWYVSNRMSDKVIKKLKRIAKINKAMLDPGFYEIFHRKINSSENKVESATLIDLFKMQRLARTTIILITFWTLTVIAFDAHVYSLKLLDGSVFVSFSLACATELPAGLVLTLMLDRWGRRFSGFIAMFSTTLFSLSEFLFKSETVKLVMSVSSRFALNMTANVGLQYAAELLPTPVRAQGIGMIHIFGILAHSIAPYIVDTAHWWTDLPMLIITVVCFSSATIVLFLPETLGRDMPQTMQQGEDFGKDQKFWSLPCLNKSAPRPDTTLARQGNGAKNSISI